MKFKSRYIAHSLFAAAAAASCGLVQAQSNVTLYGIVSQDLVRATHTPTGRITQLNNGRLNASRLGFKGAEDLGDGLYAIFGLESGINPDTGTANASFWNRGSYVGMKGKFGTFTLGNQWNVNDDLLGNFFIFGGYAVFNYRGFGETSDTFTNSAKYVSPTFSGFSFEALGALGEGGPRTWELAGNYDGGPLKAALTYHETENRTTGAKDKLTSGGVSYGMSGWNVRLGYSSANNGLSFPAAPKAAAYDVGVDYATTPLSIVSLDYVARDQKSSSADSHFFRVLARYNLSKRTQVNANIVLLKNKAGASESFYGIDAPGGKQNVFGAGISHSF